jgi:hypothetical protein
MTHWLAVYLNFTRTEKRAVGHGPGSSRIIPWLSTATAGPITPTGSFDELIHMFLNGGSGFSYYANIDFHDVRQPLSLPSCHLQY